MASQVDFSRVYSCSQCPKVFATRSNLKRHMENPNIHNIPYIRSRDQKRWKGHSKKVISKEETTERMRKWRAENREKNRQNDLRCRVYRLSRQKFGDGDSLEKQQFIKDEINRRLDRKINTKAKFTSSPSSSLLSSPSSYSSTSVFSSASPPPSHHRLSHSSGRRYKYQSSFMHSDPEEEDEIEEDEDDSAWKSDQLPFYNLPHQKIQLPSIDSLCPPLVSSTHLRRRTSSSSESSISTTDESLPSSDVTLPPVHTFLYPYPQQSLANTKLKHEEDTKILDEFVGVILDYAQDTDHHHHSCH